MQQDIGDPSWVLARVAAMAHSVCLLPAGKPRRMQHGHAAHSQPRPVSVLHEAGSVPDRVLLWRYL
jgi:hypothetical protein